jgi:hypothetical protein
MKPRTKPALLVVTAFAFSACGGTPSDTHAAIAPKPSATSAPGAPTSLASVASTAGPAPADSVANAPAETAAAVSSSTAPRVRGMPDPKVEIDPLEARPASVCSIVGTNLPFDDGCDSKAIALSSDSGLAHPMVVVLPRNISTTFALAKGTTVSSVTIAADGFTISGFTDAASISFHLAREVSAFKGGMKLLADDPVSVARVGDKRVFVRVSDAIVDLDAVDVETSCDTLLFDGFSGPPALPKMPAGDGLPTGRTLHLKSAPATVPFLALEIRDPSSIPFLMAELATQGNDTHVAFASEKARFDAWIDKSEITHGDIGMGIGRGVGHCGARPGFPAIPSTIRADTDVLVAAEPGQRGPAGVRLAKGASVIAHEAHGGWAEIAPLQPGIAPAKGLHFFVPWSAIVDPPKVSPREGLELD